MQPNTTLLAQLINIAGNVQRQADNVTIDRHYDQLAIWELVEQHSGQARMSDIRIGAPALPEATIANIAQRLERGRFVTVTPDLVDTSVTWIDVTDRGRKEATKLSDVYERTAEEILAPLTDIDKMALRRIIARLAADL